MSGKRFGTGSEVEEALGRLGSKLLYAYVEPISLVVCGGSALSVLNIAQRPTGDVDVLSLVREVDGKLVLDREATLPDSFRSLVAEVAKDLGIDDPEWVNMGPVSVLEWGAPDGFMERLVKEEYGPSLTVYYISRLDQIHFKLLASIDPKEGARHLEDLRRYLKPQRKEIRQAANWLLARNQNEGFRKALAVIIGGLGYEDIAGTI